MRPGFMKFDMKNRELRLVNATACIWTLLFEDRGTYPFATLDILVVDTQFANQDLDIQYELADKESYSILDFCSGRNQKEELFVLMDKKYINPRNTARNFIREMEL